MALREDFEDVGNWLFRWRSYLPLAIIIIFLLAFLEYTNSHPHGEQLEYIEESICFIVALLGLGIRSVTIGHTPKGTSGRNTKQQVAEILNTTGTYSVVRNPLYLGNFFMGLGIALFTGLWYLILIYVLLFWLYYERIIFAEEAFLRKKFGDVYLEWASRTPAFVPRSTQYTKAKLPFSFRNVLRREYNGFFGVIAVMFILELAKDLFAQGGIEFDLVWQMILGVGFVVWIVLRTLKRNTTVLGVTGR